MQFSFKSIAFYKILGLVAQGMF